MGHSSKNSPHQKADRRLGLTNLQDIKQLQALFNQDRGLPRLILLLSPTRPTSIAGMRWVQEELLKTNPLANMRVYTIWQPVLATDIQLKQNNRLSEFNSVGARQAQVPAAKHAVRGSADLRGSAASAKLEPLHLMSDPRVIQLWDEEKTAGKWFARHLEGFRGLVWDMYYLYGPEASWGLIPLPLVSSGATVVGQRQKLRMHLLPHLDWARRPTRMLN